MKRSRVLVVVSVLMLGIAAVLGLLGHAVFALEREARVAASSLGGVPPQFDEYDPAAPLAGLAERILGTRDDQALLEAIRGAGLLDSEDISPRELIGKHGQAVSELTRLAGESGDPKRAAAAFNLIGVLMYEDAALDERRAGAYLELSLEALQKAVELDPGNDDAKHNLEQVLSASRARASQDTQSGGESGAQSGSGAGSSPPGSGL